MRIAKTLASAAAIAVAGTAGFAGGMADQIMEAPVVVVEEVAPAGSSISPAIIVVGILAALVLVASSGDDDDTIRLR
ncbi:hypothetical protein [Yoonia sp.]|uniref:hypothetical protein n=1 Tax=Yoonia sp. TaxID=2212373 RepID=UPI002FDA596D